MEKWSIKRVDSMPDHGYNCEMFLSKQTALHLLPMLAQKFEIEMMQADVKEIDGSINIKVNLPEFAREIMVKAMNASMFKNCQNQN